MTTQCQRLVRTALLLSTMLFAAPLYAAEQFYAATFGITIDASGNLVGFRATGVMDPRDKNRTILNIPLPAEYVAAAKAQVLRKHYQPQLENGKPKEFFTWMFYVPSQPDRADLDPVRSH
ncbi:hypothetical protein SAMN02745857_03594 [Andreprevotia lacus DSM 23236]|uniref:Uncharacterized protein n=1 Tax=Andreprevotia lacus DSM 23236 TaxID=1121001 RepID=A0A1W1XYX0_9NEIS|nr:hypothetical protein [Andreprevotia lacus]SMC29092.1 hypothetical protein SAMN02745857_03594 [Andreprevotia lacus DSM 23236]